MKKSVIISLALGLCLAAAASLFAAGSMPGTVVLDSLVDRFGPVTFDHAMHTSLASECGQCHHQHGGAAGECKSCHALSEDTFKNAVVQSFLPCQSCHVTYNPAAPSIPGLKAAYHRKCFSCHGSMGRIGLDPKGCAEQCHDERQTR